MKKICVSILLIALLTVLVSCGNGFKEGEYACDVSGITFSTMTFEDGEVRNEYRSGKTKTGTYEVSDGEIAIEWTDGTSDVFEYDAENKSFSISGDDTLVWERVD